MKNNKGRVITITSRKGGVGKTTTLLNLAGVYSNLEKRVLILDLDLYSGSIASSLNIKNDKTIHNLIMDISNNRFSEFYDYPVKYNDYISVLVSLKDPRKASNINVNYIEQIITMSRHLYDVILIDTSHVLNDLNVVIYDNSDTILSILSNDPNDLVNTKTFVNIVHDIEFSDLRILLNESNSLEDKYFTLYDIKSFIGRNINYRLDKSYYVKSVDKYVMDGKILTLSKVFDKDKYKKLEKISLDLLKVNE